jgi:hypothetical protein
MDGPRELLDFLFFWLVRLVKLSVVKSCLVKIAEKLSELSARWIGERLRAVASLVQRKARTLRPRVLIAFAIAISAVLVVANPLRSGGPDKSDKDSDSPATPPTEVASVSGSVPTDETGVLNGAFVTIMRQTDNTSHVVIATSAQELILELVADCAGETDTVLAPLLFGRSHTNVDIDLSDLVEHFSIRAAINRNGEAPRCVALKDFVR